MPSAVGGILWIVAMTTTGLPRPKGAPDAALGLYLNEVRALCSMAAEVAGVAVGDEEQE